jgi:hypothetical protein
MLWFAIGLLAVLLLYAAARARKLAPLFTDGHLAEVAAQLPDLKRRALAGGEGPPASFQTSLLAAAYSIARDEPGWVHHLSVSSPVTPARAAGTFFLGLLRGVLRLDAYPLEAFVSPSQVFHLVVRLSDEQQQAFVDQPVEAMTTEALRGVAIAGRGVIFPVLKERDVPAPALPKKQPAT